MSGRFVRASKYRHVFGRSTKKEQCYDNLRISKNAWDSNIIKANPQYISVNWEASGGGAFAVIPINERGKLPEQIPLFRGHKAAVLDTDWSPFDDSLIASGSDDGKARNMKPLCYVFLWKVPENFTLHSDAEEPADVGPAGQLTGHARKVGHVLFNPSAANVLASSSGDYTIKLWDVEAGSARLTLKHGDIVQSLSWSANGALMVTTCRDKKLRIWDVRQEKPVHEVPGHAGAKNSRAVWMGEHDRMATTGFSRMSDRQLGLWDIRAPKEPIGGFQILDSISGVCMPFWDDGTKMLYLAGKGDGNIRYYEYENDKFEYLSEYKSADPQRGIAFLPKRGVNVHENEIMRAFKTVNDTFIEPIPFIVPRRAEVFQSDIYPPTVGLNSAMSSSDWFVGKEGLPPKISLESIYEGEEPEIIPADNKPAFATSMSPPATKTQPEPPKPAPAAEPALTFTQRGPPPSMKDNKGSMADIASKFADKADSESSSDDDTSSFEEVPKPVERPLVARMEQKTRGPSIGQDHDEQTGSVINQRAAQLTSSPAVQDPPTSTPTSVNVPTKTTSAAPPRAVSATFSADGDSKPTPTPSGAAEGIKSYLQDIKSMLEQQSRAMSDQMNQITTLTKEVDTLKSRLSEQSSRDERIRQLELELEEARS